VLRRPDGTNAGIECNQSPTPIQNVQMFVFARTSHLDPVFAPEHVVDFGEVVRSRREIVDVTFWCEVLLLVGLFA
jgi:hypothetical protein